MRQVGLKHKRLPIAVEAEDVLARLLGEIRLQSFFHSFKAAVHRLGFGVSVLAVSRFNYGDLRI